MPPRPFPFALRVGTDIVSVKRVQQTITRTGKDRNDSFFLPFLNKLLTRREQQVFTRTFPDFTVADTARLQRVSQHLAGRWAAKEAAIKATKPRKLLYLDVEVLRRRGDKSELYGLIRDNTFVHEPFGIKRLKLENNTTEGGPAASKQVEESDDDPAGQMVAMSISHDRDYATAVCIAPLGPVPGDVGGEAAARMYDGAEGDADYWKQ